MMTLPLLMSPASEIRKLTQAAISAGRGVGNASRGFTAALAGAEAWVLLDVQALRRLTRADWLHAVALSAVGTFLYYLLLSLLAALWVLRWRWPKGRVHSAHDAPGS